MNYRTLNIQIRYSCDSFLTLFITLVYPFPIVSLFLNERSILYFWLEIKCLWDSKLRLFTQKKIQKIIHMKKSQNTLTNENLILILKTLSSCKQELGDEVKIPEKLK